ncbi:CYTH and CHAD domain-containing protein [Thalassospira australica]|uniref:CYTH and CHAD domain-containing protein n=1 Tax=Thalassospira australica TaxID=1528106 RepID=UPI00051A8778|nr:CYTH and CHAD domain-containing protein [Thalassospira australica]
MTEKQIEIELKLRIDPKHVARLKNAPVLREVKEGRRLLTTHLVSIYHDTPKLSLADKGLAVRLRKKGGRGWEQTVKATNGLREALPERNEWTVELEEGALDLDRFTDKDVKKLLKKFVKKKKIERIFESDLKRGAVDLTYRDAVMELAIDQGVVRAGDKEAPISEVEFELKKGHPAALFDLALELQRTVPLLLSMRSKASRGRDLYLGRGPGAYRAAPVALTPDMSAETAFRLVLAQGLRMILSNEVCVRQDIDVEGCHQMRVGMRRLRVALNLFKKNLPAGEAVLLRRLLKKCSKGLDDLRDWDVFLGETLPMIEARFPEHGGIPQLRKAAEKQRAAALAAAHDMLDQPEYGQLLLLLGAWASYSRWASGASAEQMKAMAAPVSEMAEPLLDQAYNRVTKRRAQIADLTIPQLHALRLDVKQMRYGTEFFGAIYGAKKVKKFRTKLVGMQEILGQLQDAAVAEKRLIALAPQLSKDGMIAVGLISGWFGARADHKLEGLQQAMQGFTDQKPFWK